MMKKIEDMTPEELQYLTEHDIIDSELVTAEIMRRTKEEIKNKYHIWQASDGRYKTHLYVGGKRKLIAKPSEEDMILYLMGLEKDISLSSMSFGECFQKFKALRAETVDVNTIQKYDSEYERHFAGTEFEKKRIASITMDDILVFAARTIRNPKFRGKPSDRPLAVRGAKQLWYMIYDTFEWAVRHKVISAANNPCREIDFKRDFYKLTEDIERPQDKIIVPPDQIKKLNAQYKADHEADPYYIPTYAVELAALTGMRAGEIAALRWDRIYAGYICIDSYDSTDKTTGTNRIKKRPKNQKNRYIPVTADIQQLLDNVKAVETEKGWLSEYVFSGANGRLTTSIISSCLKNKCSQAGVTSKGINAYRRTVNSLLRANGLSAQGASSLLGNTVLVNNEYYTFDVSSAAEKMQSLVAANDYMRTGGEPSAVTESR